MGAEGYAGDVGADAFAQMAGYLDNRPDWTDFDPAALCVANREVHPSIVASGINWVCSQEGSECDDVPSLCSADPYRLGDFVFSRFARGARAKSSWNPLIDCSFGGAALFAPSEVYEQWVGAHACAADVSSTTSLTTLTSTTTATTSLTSTSITSETTGMEASTSTHTDDAFLGS